MLAGLLPGLRELRTPLTVGYLWLLNAWLFFGGHVPRSSEHQHPLIARAFEVADVLGRPAALAALTLVAFLVGTVLTSSQLVAWTTNGLTWTWRRFRLRHINAGDVAASFVNLGLEGERHLDSLLARIRPFVVAEGRAEFDDPAVQLAYNTSNADLRARLLTSNQEVFAEYDRLSAEAGFRIAVAIPLGVLLFAGAIRLDWPIWWPLPVVAALALLIRKGVNAEQQARLTLQRAMTLGVFKHPLELLVERYEKAAAEERSDVERLGVSSAPSVEWFDLRGEGPRFQSTWVVTVRNLNPERSIWLTTITTEFVLLNKDTGTQDFTDGPSEVTSAIGTVDGVVEFPHQLAPGAEVRLPGNLGSRVKQLMTQHIRVVRVTLVFVDDLGRHWERSPDGQLRRLLGSGPVL